MRNHARFIVLLAALMPVLFSVGCNTVRAPKFESVGVREIERTDARTVYGFLVKATNPNRDPIPLREVTYTITLDDSYTFSGVRSPESTLHTFGEHTFELPAVFEVPASSLVGLMDFKITGHTKFLRPGKLNEVLFDSNVSVPKAPLNLRGKVNADDASSGTGF